MLTISARQQWLPRVRFWLGLNLVLFTVHLVTPILRRDNTPLAPAGILESFLLTALGLLIGLTYGRYWPVPDRPGIASVARVALLTIPAVGFSLALGLLLQPQVTALTLALAAFLGAQVRQPPAATGQGVHARPGAKRRRRPRARR